MSARLDKVLQGLPHAYPGPGGAVAVLRDGQVLARYAWGWANAEQRIAFTPKTLFRICSITKQFTCALVLDAFDDPTALDGDVAAFLPGLEQPAPGALHLCHNQSGLRDYWAVAMLQGALAEQPFGARDAAGVIAGARTLQFEPGTRYSYVNQNFRILSDVLEARTGRGFGELLRARLFDPAGMDGAIVGADTRALPDGAEGYEGSQAAGFRPARNNILWTGDAGLAASLDDMIAWERWIDAGRDDPGGLYRRLCAPVAFAGGAPAAYGFGLRRGVELGRVVSGHGGALRGWRSHRLYAPSERLSVVVLFNHMADAHAAAVDLLAAALDEDRPERPKAGPPPAWLGAYMEPQTGLSARIEAVAEGVRLRFAHVPETLALDGDGAALEDVARLRPNGGGLVMDRPAENASSRLAPLAPPTGDDIAGRYACAEIEAELQVEGSGGVFYGRFAGPLGQGRMELLDPIGADVWALPCPRALDHSAPGDWTLAFRRGPDGRTSEATVGCWLARGLVYRRA